MPGSLSLPPSLPPSFPPSPPPWVQRKKNITTLDEDKAPHVILSGVGRGRHRLQQRWLEMEKWTARHLKACARTNLRSSVASRRVEPAVPKDGVDRGPGTLRRRLDGRVDRGRRQP